MSQFKNPPASMTAQELLDAAFVLGQRANVMRTEASLTVDRSKSDHLYRCSSTLYAKADDVCRWRDQVERGGLTAAEHAFIAAKTQEFLLAARWS
jgi:hypothetical protein